MGGNPMQKIHAACPFCIPFTIIIDAIHRGRPPRALLLSRPLRAIVEARHRLRSPKSYPSICVGLVVVMADA
jgi:hypothetical protein